MADDGTQDPGPPPVLSDPLSGLVTGSRYEPVPLKVRVVQPPMPDLSAVREAMAGMLDEDSELSLGLAAHSGATTAAPDEAAQAETRAETTETTETTEAPAAETAEPPPTPPIGIPAQQTAEPPEPREPPRAPAPARVVTPGTIESTSRVPRRFLPMPRSEPRPAAAVGRRSSAPSVAAIAVLLLVIGTIAIVLISSLLDTLASIFG